MEPRFTRGEYWLLETVVEREFEVCALIDSNLESFGGLPLSVSPTFKIKIPLPVGHAVY